MVCRSCGTTNRPGRRFCASCGAALPVVCPACGTHNEPGERFCGECGTALVAPDAVARPTGTPAPAAPAPAAPAPAAPARPRATLGGRRERKVATAVFADLVGSTALNEAHDPEVVQAVVSDAFDRLSQEVGRYEGLIEKFAGDAMLALFGVPQVHEDDAERAVRAALEMQAAMVALAEEARAARRPELSLRIGIETGEVLVDQARAAAERDRMVTGDPVNTAARLQSEAAPGAVVVGAGTYAATRALIEYEELAPLTVKGKAQPVAAWRAVAVKARRGGVRAPLGIQAPLVGRDAEMALLKETVRRMAAERRPHLVTVLGAAGVGKSRITWELEKYLDGLPEAYVWRKGRCLAYAQSSLGALAEVIRSDGGIREDDASNEAVAALARRLDELPPRFDDPDRDILHGVIGLGDVPEVGRDALFDTLRRYVEALAQVAPAVLVFEDIHWADEGLLDLVETIARWGSGPILLLCLARHELLERRPSWSGGVPNAATIVLEPLAQDENARLVEGLMPGGIPAELQARIVQLADGNPLFTEELVRMFIDRGVIRYVDGRWQLAQAVDELEVPGSVQAVLSARLDALPEREKQLAQDAAVVGRVFWDAVLAYLAGDRPPRVDELLRRLRVKELVVPREPSSLSGAAEFGFRHVLIRDVAYDSLPKRERAVKHLSVAEWAERELGERTDELAELLASHYLSALRYREEFGGDEAELRRLREQTYRYARLATERAGRLYEKAGATRWARVALDLAAVLGLDAVERARAAWAYLGHGFGHWPMEEAWEVAEAALAALGTVHPPTPELLELEAQIRGITAFVLQGLDRTAEARRILERQLDRLPGAAPSSARAQLLSRLGWVLWRSGPPAVAIPVLERALGDARAIGARRVEAWALHELGVVAGQTGDLAGGAAMLRLSLELAREVGDTTLVMRTHNNLASLLTDQGPDWEEVERLLSEGVALARRSSDRGHEGWLLFQMAAVAERRGRLAEAHQYVRQSLEIAEQLGDLVQTGGRRQALAWHAASRGRWDEAEAIVAQGGMDEWASDEQGHVWALIWESWRRWRDDPEAAVALLERELPRIEVDRIWGTHWLARMAFRTGSRSALHAAVSDVSSSSKEVPFHTLVRRWIEALAGRDAEVPTALMPVADGLDAMGYRSLLEWMWADIALALARNGQDAGDAIARVAELDASMDGLVPALGPLPETRWTAAAPREPRRATARA